jgi:hemoglobin
MAELAKSTALDLLGGEPGIRRWVDRFYSQVPGNPVLAPLFPPDLTESADKQFAFFVEFFGGPALYSQKYGQAFLRYKHRKAKIGVPERDAWMGLMLSSLKDIVDNPELVQAVGERLDPIATHMINHDPDKKDAMHFN